MTKEKFKSMPTVVVGMSGGVDSSVAAYLLKEEGYNVIGIFMKNWEETKENGVCHAASDYDDVVRVCECLDIPYYSVNFVEEYRKLVFDQFLEEYKSGYTPNPDILCNREIKFSVFLKKALSLGADFLATGHYCQNHVLNDSHHLIKGIDPNKDQSYFLYTLKESILQKVLFPIGHLHKEEVRKIAKDCKLPTAEKKESMGICFIGKRNFKDFLHNYLPYTEGNIENVTGKVIGKHQGVAFYTLGQRKGIGIGGEGEAYFVVGKDSEKNILIVAQGKNHPSLYCDEITASDLSWVSGKAPSLPLKCRAKIRYRQKDQECILESIQDGIAHITFSQPQRAATPRQSIVFYDGQDCLGGGMIKDVGPSYYVQNKTLPLLDPSES